MSAALNAHKITISLCIVDCKSRENVRLSVSHKSQFNGYATLLCSGSMMDQDYTIPKASVSLGVGESAIRRWVNQLAEERNGVTPKGKALTPEQRRIQELEARCNRLEREKEILKTASTPSRAPLG